MTEISTLDRLVKYVYDDVCEQETQEIKLQSLINSEIYEILNQLRALKTHLEHLRLNPSDESISRILEYSRQYDF